ncbi:hypothetical protein C3K47_17165 [Solitalea longa]|uniref:Uncharacterized protein n=1 Tax=Solitalea longa TaxID=2079460 RepID=A0A2S4ZX97_9SPHI|nr:hypothetical protein C3K47_17165 [Solitalea longa]
MKVWTIILIHVLLTSCSEVEQIDVNSIRIVKVNQHPFLADHERKLMTVDKKSKTMEVLTIYPDTGEGCEAYLFESGSKYIY